MTNGISARAQNRMTSTLAGIIVEGKHIDWNTCVADVFSNWRSKIDSAWLDVTLEQLLSHRGGAPETPPSDLWQHAWKQIGTPTNQRVDFVKGLLLQTPHPVRGTKCVYSNQGYAIAGLMIETCTGRDWGALIRSWCSDRWRMILQDLAHREVPSSATNRGDNSKPLPPSIGGARTRSGQPCRAHRTRRSRTLHRGSC